MQLLSSQQRLNLVNTNQLYAAWEEAFAAREHYRYGMRWKKVGDREYLYHQKGAGGHATSLGPRSATTEKLWSDFETGRTRYQARLAELRSKLEEQARLNKALRLNRVPNIVAEIIRKLDEHAASKDFKVVGTHALYAYEAQAAAFFFSELLASGDVDSLYDPRKKLSIVSEKLNGKGLLGALREADRSFRKMNAEGFRAVNEKGFMVDLIMPAGDMHATSVQFAEGDLAAIEVPSLQWLTNAPSLQVVAIAEDGLPVRMRVPDPRAFAIHKLWLSQRPDREPVKRPRDEQQARAVAQMIFDYLPNLPFDKAELRYLPERLVDDALARLRPIAEQNETAAAELHELFAGLRNIEREIIEKLRDRDIQIAPGDFVWNGGRTLVPAPEAFSVAIKVQRETYRAAFTREGAEDSHERIARPDVVAMIDFIVDRISRKSGNRNTAR